MTLQTQAEIMARAMSLLITAANKPRATSKRFEIVPTGYTPKLKAARSTLSAEQIALVDADQLDGLPGKMVKRIATFSLVRKDTSRYQGEALAEIKKRPINAKQMRRKAAQTPLALAAE